MDLAQSRVSKSMGRVLEARKVLDVTLDSDRRVGRTSRPPEPARPIPPALGLPRAGRPRHAHGPYQPHRDCALRPAIRSAARSRARVPARQDARGLDPPESPPAV